MNKEVIEDIILAEVSSIEQGDKDALELLLILRELEKLLSDSIKTIMPTVLEEIALYPKGKATLNGYDISLQNGRASWDFREITEITDAANRLKELQERSKKAFLALERNEMLVDEDGVVIQPALRSIGAPFIKVEKARNNV